MGQVISPTMESVLWFLLEQLSTVLSDEKSEYKSWPSLCPYICTASDRQQKCCNWYTRRSISLDLSIVPINMHCFVSPSIEIIIVIIIAIKDAIWDFLQTPHSTVSNTHAQVAQEQSCANHVHHIKRLSRATCHVTCHLVQRDSSATKFDRVEIAFIWALSRWLNH